MVRKDQTKDSTAKKPKKDGEPSFVPGRAASYPSDGVKPKPAEEEASK